MERARTWLEGSYDPETKAEIKRMIENDRKELEDAFYRNLEFGTGGLRGVIGPGTNRVNRYTIGMATQGLANYILKSFPGKKELSVAVCYDCRNYSREFAQITADVFSANGIKVNLFRELRPTPELSYAVRSLKCAAGVMITASHNPKEYNGYKVYWEDGAQITAPHDKNIIKEVTEVDDPSKVRFSGNDSLVHMVGEEMDGAYLEAVLSLSLSRDIVARFPDFKIVYTPLHGTGVKMVPLALKMAGFNNVMTVAEQNITDGNFPTVDSPNPEEPLALKMALELAEEKGASLVLATDPDADRIGVAVRDNSGKLLLLNGNQTATIISYYLLERWSELGNLEKSGDNGMYYMAKTIVTTDLLRVISESYGVEMFNVLTGFKYIAEVVRKNEGKRVFIGGGEESFGFNAGEYVRDKDAVVSAVLISEAAVWAAASGRSLFELLIDIYVRYGFYKERLVSVTKRGIDGLRQIDLIMKKLRESPFLNLAGSETLLVHDYLSSGTIDLVSDLRYAISLPPSNVLQYVSCDNSMISVRPSGTEPKIKYYLAVRGSIKERNEFPEMDKELEERLDRLQAQVSLL